MTASTQVALGAWAAACSVCVMIPLDTVKVRMTTGNPGGVAYASVGQAISLMLRDEGVGAPARTSVAETSTGPLD